MRWGAYIGVKHCGCKVAACVDSPEYKNDTAKSIAQWIREGLTVEHIELDNAETVPIKRCIHKDALPQEVTK